ncbi:MAG: prepilin-type N-terminal cleavage/methylation domain-containing protein [Fibrobacter sp.]|jgi:prepilin-type N-terminal cleavage/methylation domain-containing protein|nr:prepilin-type N-terminal cleavage/methylation domain-containing protein [Fibrobacter sp.]
MILAPKNNAVVVASAKRGFTLIELLTVVTIIGILSAAGVVSFRNAVLDNRARDAAVNLAAFAERVEAKARQFNAPLCIKKGAGNELLAYRGTISVGTGGKETCTIPDGGTPVDFITFGSPLALKTAKESGLAGSNWNDAVVAVQPRIGLSAYHTEGHFTVQYGNTSRWAAASKSNSDNRFKAQFSRNGGTLWESL